MASCVMNWIMIVDVIVLVFVIIGSIVRCIHSQRFIYFDIYLHYPHLASSSQIFNKAHKKNVRLETIQILHKSFTDYIRRFISTSLLNFKYSVVSIIYNAERCSRAF